MKNSKRGPLSIRVIFTLKMVVSLLFALAFTAAEAQPLTLVKDINTPQTPDLKNAVVYAVGNKVYYSDATGNGTKLVYTGAANATIVVKVEQPFSGKSYFFVESSPNSAKILRYNFVTIETIATGTTITDVNLLGFQDRIRYVVNGNQAWTLTATGAPLLIKTFATPIKYTDYNAIATANSLWLMNYSLNTATLAKDGFTEIGEFGESGFAANDGGFNGTELWAASLPGGAYLLKDINPGTASSNPRNFFSAYFTATSEGQNHIYIRTYDSIYRVLTAPIGSDIKPVGSLVINRNNVGVPGVLFVLQTGNVITVNTFEERNTNNQIELARFTDGRVVFDRTPNYFTHVKANGTSELWAINSDNNTAFLAINNAGLEDVYASNYVGSKDGKLWRLNGNSLPVPATLVQDFGANAQISVKGERATYAINGGDYRRLVLFTRTINGVTTTFFAEYTNSTNTVTEVTANTLPADQYPSYPNEFREINGKLLFKASDSERGEEIWRTDGTTAGTQLFKELRPGPYGLIERPVTEGNFVYYISKNQTGSDVVVWKTDGTTIDSVRRNTAEYQTIISRQNFYTPAQPLVVGTVKYAPFFSSYQACFGRGCPTIYNGGIFRISGTDTAFVFSFNFTGGGPEPIKSLKPLGNKFYFTFTQTAPSAIRGALWGSDGTAAGTTIIKNFEQRPSDITVANGKLYFTADDGINGLSLWTSDGTTAGTTVVATFKTPTYAPRFPIVNKIYAQGNSLYFLVTSLISSDSVKLWSHRLGSNALGKVADFNSVSDMLGNNNALFNGALLLPQTNPQVGTELFKFQLQEAPVGNPVSNQADLALTQTVTQTQTRDSVFLSFNLTVKNNGAQTATNVLTNFVGFNALYVFGTASFRDTVASLGYISTPFTNQTAWTIPTLNNGQSATLRFVVPVSKQFYQRATIYTATNSNQFDGNVANNTAEYATEFVVEPCTGPVNVKMLVDYYLDQTSDASPIVIQNPNAPSGQYLADGTSNTTILGDQFIRRARGYLKPVETGAYKFFVAGDDNVDVYLSTDDNPANKQRIAYVNGFTGFSEFNKYASQTSVSINLMAGRRYYLEIVNAEKFGSDYYNLEWKTPSATASAFIPFVESFCGNPVAALPDLTLQNLVVRDPSVSAGQIINYTVDAKNIGTANVTSGLNFKTFLSNDQTLDANDVQVGLSLLPTLNAGQTLAGVAGQISTSAALTGTFYVILKIDPENTVAESNENNNTLVSASTVTISPTANPLPDLTLRNLNVTNSNLQQGQTLATSFDVVNIGSARAGAFSVSGYLSKDNSISSDDLQETLATESFLNAAVGVSRTAIISIPANFPTGQYYFIAKVDPNNQIVESEEINNTIVFPTLITITAVPNNNTYCASKGVAPWEYAISNVSFGTLNNTSDKFKDFNTLGYSDFTNLSTTLTKGQTYPLSITPILSWIGNLPTTYARVWIDYNQNKTFEANELVLERTNANPLTQNVLVPTTALTGATRMRVSLKNGSYPTACEAFDKGEVEDYTVQITEGSSLCTNDATPPVFNSCPANQLNEGFSLGCTPITWRVPTATDNCSTPTLTFVLKRNSAILNQTDSLVTAQLCLGSYTDTVVYTARDARGNTAICQFEIKAIDRCIADQRNEGFLPNNQTFATTGSNCVKFKWAVPVRFYPCGRVYRYEPWALPTVSPTVTIGRADLRLANGGNTSTVIDSACFPVGTTIITYRDFNNAVQSFRVLVSNPSENTPDLTLANLSPRNPSVSQGQNVNFTFDAKNVGTGNVTNAFTIKSYLSTDAVLDANDYQNGSIPTANYAAGSTISQIQGALNVANTVAVGNYYLILKIDADNQITESNEANNVLVSTSTIAVTAASVGTNDIALTISGDPSVYRQYSTQNFRVSAKNNGSTAFTNVKIKFTRPALTVNGGTKIASVGTFQDFCPNSVECSEWTIPTLAANTTATLDVPTYVLNPTAAITATATLLASTPVDNVTANNTATVSINRSTAPAVQSLILSKPSQQIPIVIQRINPTLTDNYIVVELESIVDKQVDFHILNALGTIVSTEKLTIEKGNNKRQFDVSQLPKGLYLIQTSVGQGRNVPMKFVKF